MVVLPSLETQRVRVAIVINTSWNIYNYRKGLINAFLDKGWRVTAIAPPDNYSSRLEDLGCKFIPVEMENKGLNPLKDIALIWRLFNIYRKEKPDCVLHYTIKPNVYGSIAAKLNGIRCISNVSGLGTAFIRRGLLLHIVKWLYKFAFLFPQRIFFQNSDDRDLFVSLYILKEKRTDLLPGSGINVDEYPLFDFPKGRPYVFVLIARLLSDKGIREYVKASQILKEKGYTFTAQLVGFFDRESAYNITREELEIWQSRGYISFLGASDHIYEVIADAHCVVLPSYREGTPRSLLEAMSIGRPIVTTNVAGCKEVIIDGLNGYICEAKDAESLALAMEKMLKLKEDELEKMGLEGRKIIIERFDEKWVVDKYFKEILSKNDTN